ncbi:GNAT family N-acetyltransferase [Ensifer soli]|uniref:GNAT family N-acetyltransferase n=1 Tax=Ciceribacter sp. sgz301302 TaxID=3342379 RepID=UPI0035B88584
MLDTASADIPSLPPAAAIRTGGMLTIRAARPRDIDGLAAMIVELARDHGDLAAVTPAELGRDLFGDMPWAQALIAETGGTLIGFALLTPLYRAWQGMRGMELNQLYVAPAHRGTGIGRHLVAKAREQARIAGCAYLSVSAATGNFKAHRFYESEQFTPGPVTGMRYIQTLA